MARRHVRLTIIVLAICAVLITGRATTVDGAADSGSAEKTATLATRTVGSTAFIWTNVTDTLTGNQSTVTTRSGNVCGYWSVWRLIAVNQVTHARRYAQFIYDGCDGDRLIVPIPTDAANLSCNNDDNLYRSARYSLCIWVPPSAVPAGEAFDQNCMALAETAVSLHADVTPNPAAPASFAVSTSFSTDFQQRLSEATCSDVLSWRVTAWELQWPDGAVDTKPGSAQQGITDVHTLKTGPPPDPTTVHVIARAHLHITAQAVDFDSNANPYVRTMAADIVVSNDASALAGAGTPTYTAPQLHAAAICEMQAPDGTLQPYRPTDPLDSSCQVMRGRLDQVYPQVDVVRPGAELLNGVDIGTARSVLTGWTYMGTATDAPARYATNPGDTGPAGVPINVQWNHASRIDESHPVPIPEQVPFRASVLTTYPDGHTDTETVSGSIPVTIFYVGLNFTG